MLTVILLILIIFWFMGYGPLETLRFPLFRFGHYGINLWEILMFLAFIWIISSLPRPLKEIVTVLLVLWLLSLFGIIFIVGFSKFFIIAVIVGLGIYIISGK